jgi:hypothetical protein
MRGRKPKEVDVETICDTLKLGRIALTAKALHVSRAYIYAKLKEAGLYDKYKIHDRGRIGSRTMDASEKDLCDVPALR